MATILGWQTWKKNKKTQWSYFNRQLCFGLLSHLFNANIYKASHLFWLLAHPPSSPHLSGLGAVAAPLAQVGHSALLQLRLQLHVQSPLVQDPLHLHLTVSWQLGTQHSKHSSTHTKHIGIKVHTSFKVARIDLLGRFKNTQTQKSLTNLTNAPISMHNVGECYWSLIFRMNYEFPDLQSSVINSFQDMTLQIWLY